ncbi:MAG: hypothetical protein N2Z22_10475, partial [Turneriella sp.]|nr:hypothetical protein [Turneriella sp.]
MVRKLPIAKAALALIALLQATSGCARLGESGLTFSEQELLPEQLISTGEDRPGMGASGGPLFWSFWAKNRTAASDAMVASFAPFYRVNAVRLAVSPHFVFYRDVLQATPNVAQAASILATLENAYNNLKMVYGGSEHPYPHNAARIVILALDILDDYTTTGNYVGGFFSPRDLYSNRFTTALFTDPVAIQQYAEYIATLGGYSNELSIIYYDTNPGFT